MKKTLAFILVCALLVSAFTLTAFAEKIVGGADGVTDIPANSTSGSVNVKVDKVFHKYAADLTYTDAVYALPTMTWNVNTLMYEVTGENLNADTTITITNRSDLPIDATLTVADPQPTDGLSLKIVNGGGRVDTLTATIGAVVVNAVNTAGTEVDYAFTCNLGNPDNTAIKTAVTYYTEGAGQSAVTDNKAVIATYTVVIAMPTP